MPSVDLPALPGPRIGLVNKFWGRDRGGVEAVLYAEALALQRQGYCVSVLACRPVGGMARPFPAGLRGRELRAPVVASMPVNPGFALALQHLAGRSELLHFHLPFPLAEAAALYVRKRGPWVATLHAEVVNHPAWMRALQRRCTRRFLGRVDAIITSSAASTQCATLAGLAAPVHVIPFAFDLHRFLALAGPPPRRPPTIVFLGRLVPYKGVDVLLHAAAGLNAQLHILGDGRERVRLQRLAQELGIAPRVHFFGHVPDAELPGRLRAGDVFALPSCTPAETFGVAQVEAMAAGLPVVNTALGTATDWVSVHGLTGLTVPPGDAAALAAALRLLLADRPYRLACGRRARLRARALFSLERGGPHLGEIYQDLLAQPRLRAMAQRAS